MAYFISNSITKLMQDSDTAIIYNKQTNRLLKVSNDLYGILLYFINSSIKNKINEKSQEFLHVSSTEAFNKLLKYKFIYDGDMNTSEDYSIRYSNFNTDVRIDHVYLHVTQKCNLKCKYCYNKDNLNIIPELKTNEMIRVISKLNDVGIRDIIITGGEPLLREDIIELCKYMKTLDMSIEILTNGSLLYKRIEILKYIDHMIISIDPGDDLESQRIGLDRNIIYDALKELTSIEKQKISIRSVITKGAESLIGEMENFVTNELVCNFMYTPCLPNSIHDIKNLPDYDMILGFEKDCIYRPSRCGACYRVIAINSNGDIYPCQNLIIEDFLLTNILDDDWLNKIDISPITQNFRHVNVDNIKKCKKCDISYLCGGGCRALAYKVYNELDANLDFMCESLRRMCIERIGNINYS